MIFNMLLHTVFF